MKISYNWLNEFLPKTFTPEELDHLLTDTGLEVEGFETIEAVKGGLAHVVVAEVMTCEQHPNADRLKVTTVNNGTEIVQVVCGAPNVAVGQKVILAQVGAVLYPSPDQPLKMKVSKIRDVESFGMLCAEDELGLGESHAGIMVLDPSAKVGTPAADYLQLESDVQIEIGLTPNRADAMGHVGVARDVYAYLSCHESLDKILKLKELDIITKTSDLPVGVQVLDQERCPRYMTLTFTDVANKPSPAWMQNRLRAVGIAPINAVVDCTNYVMRELGTPLHAFDAAKVGEQLIVRTAEKGEKLITLDGVERTLDNEDLIIANASEPLCIAGVFGGKDSGIADDTTEVVLEAAFFQPVSVRKSAKRHGLSTDASFRFERGVDVDMVPYALHRAAQLICEITGAKIASNPTDFYPIPVQRRTIEFRLARCKQLLGHEIPSETIKRILLALDFEITTETSETFDLLVPNYRIDVDREIDVIEEVLRIYGFNLIPLPEKLNTSLLVAEKPDLERLNVAVSEMLAGFGFYEMMNNSLTTPVYTEKLGGAQLIAAENVQVLNPLSQELAVMRQTLVFQAMETVAHNQNRQNPDVKLMEFGKVYKVVANEYKENKRLLLVVSGRKLPETWNSTADKSSFYTIKGIVISLLERLGLNQLVNEVTLESADLLQDGYSMTLLKKSIGSIGWVNAKTRKHFGVKNDVFVADLDWDALIDSLKLAKTQAKELPKTFAVRRDFSLLLDQQVTFAAIQEIARKVDKKILQQVGLFDVYEGKNLPEGKKSYAVSFIFQDAEQTLKDEQVDKIMNQIHSELVAKLGAELRA
jgi:phenylalanyl-tRNA synthetase beta chain